jgi:hypothetical protein
MTEYTEGFKSKVVQKMLGPRGKSASSLAVEIGIPQTTLSRWLRSAQRTMERMPNSSKGDRKEPTKARRAEDWTAEERLRVLNDSAGLEDEELGAFLRREGLYASTLHEWRAAALEGLVPSKVSRAEQKRVKELERELRRKDRALAEAAALLVLQKKVQALLAAGEGDTDERSDE